jgi:hypothetical protein
MTDRFAVYRVAGHRLVQGWLQPEVLDIAHTLDTVQRENDVSGAKFDPSMRVSAHDSIYAGHDVKLLFRTPRTPRRLLRKNATARTLYRSLVRGAS